MSHLIIKFIGITQDDRVIIERASNNLRPLEFRTLEIEPLTALYREKGLKALEEELLWLFFTLRPGHRTLQTSGAGRFVSGVPALFGRRRVSKAANEIHSG